MKRLLLTLICVLATMPARAELPYQRHGWSAEEAAAHLLARFTFGAQPGQVQAVANQGLENWLDSQLAPTFPNQALKAKLSELPSAYTMSNQQIVEAYPDPGQLLAKARKEGRIGADPSQESRRELIKQARQEGARPIKELGTTLLAQKLYHARYSQAQVQEVMTEFWFNHFNVAASNNRARRFLLSYERDALRPQALGQFRTLLGKTAKHPAMLWYLDNATSTAGPDALTLLEGAGRAEKAMKNRRKGLNENYARELLELHTLGVDGGYSQNDVTETARVLTGWTVVPYERAAQLAQFTNQGAKLGMVRQGDFLFAAPLHDAGAKKVLGQTFPAGGGLEEGERLLDTVANHPSTARHLAKKLAVRFVSDQPSEALISKLSQVFQRSGGDTRELLKAIASSDEFWQPSQRGSKVKSPLELMVSAARILEADLQPTPQVYDWLNDMGQPLYNYQAPTGFPDQAESWVSSGTVLQRMNFGLESASGRVLGFSYSVQPAADLKTVVARLLPAQDPGPVLAKVQPLLANANALTLEKPEKPELKGNLGGKLPGVKVQPMSLSAEHQGVATMIGLVLGSPEFQRR